MTRSSLQRTVQDLLARQGTSITEVVRASPNVKDARTRIVEATGVHFSWRTLYNWLDADREHDDV